MESGVLGLSRSVSASGDLALHHVIFTGPSCKSCRKVGGVLFSLRISAFLCVSVVNRLSAHIYPRGAEERRDTQRRNRIKRHNRKVAELRISPIMGFRWATDRIVNAS